MTTVLAGVSTFSCDQEFKFSDCTYTILINFFFWGDWCGTMSKTTACSADISEKHQLMAWLFQLPDK